MRLHTFLKTDPLWVGGYNEAMMSQDRVDIAGFASTLPIEYNTTQLRKAGILIDLPTPVWDKRTQEIFLRVGNQFYWSEIRRKSFHEILIDHLSTILGKEWKLAQASMPLSERHFVFECYNETDDYLNGGAVDVRKENEELNSVALVSLLQAGLGYRSYHYYTRYFVNITLSGFTALCSNLF